MKITDEKLDEMLKDDRVRSKYKMFEFRKKDQAAEKTTPPVFRRLAVIAVAALLAIGLIIAGVVTAAKTASHGIPTPPDVIETVPVPVTEKDTETAGTLDTKTEPADSETVADITDVQTEPDENSTGEDITDTQTGLAIETREPVTQPVTEEVTTPSGTQTFTTEITTSELPYKETVAFTKQGNTDRLPRKAEIELSRPEIGYNDEYGIACCIITVLNIDKSGISSTEIGKRVPVEIRLDKVLSKNLAFALDEGDITAVGEFTAWFKTDEGYMVQFRDDVIPMTEEGAQYIILIYSAEESSEREYWNNVEYMAEPLTLPVFDNGTYDKGLYDIMKLAEDVRACSEDLIKQFFAAE